MAIIIVQQGIKAGQIYEMQDQPLTIGRSRDNDVVLLDRNASRYHAKVVSSRGRHLLTDLDSQNGCLVNGRQVVRRFLEDGDEITIGSSVLVYRSKRGDSVVTQREVPLDLRGKTDPSLPAPRPPAKAEPSLSPETTIIRDVSEDLAPYDREEGQEEEIADPTVAHRELKKLQRKARSFETLYHVSKALHSAPSLGELLEEIMALVFKVTRADRGYLMLLEEGGRLDPKVSRHRREGTNIDGPAGARVQISQTIVNTVIQRRQAVLSFDAPKDPRFSAGKSIILFDIRSVLCVPLWNREEIIGVIYLDSFTPESQFTEGDLDLMTAIANQAAIAIMNARMTEEKLRTERIATLGQMASTIIHDFKTPLSTILGYAEFLMLPQFSEGEKVEFFTYIREEIDHMVDMAQELLDFSRGHKRLRLREEDISAFLDQTLAPFGKELEERSIRLALAHGFRGTFPLDRDRMRRVVKNIVSNACDAMAKGGTLDIRTIEARGGGLVIHFSDSGCGIPEALRAKIFDAFVTHGKKSGTGLGMAIVKKIVEDHGGTIEVDSREGEGTTFTVRLERKGRRNIKDHG